MSKPFVWQELFVQSKDSTEYELLSNQHVTVTELDGEEVIKVAPEALTLLAQQAFYEASFFLRAGHLKQIASILHDPQASSNDSTTAVLPAPSCESTATLRILSLVYSFIKQSPPMESQLILYIRDEGGRFLF